MRDIFEVMELFCILISVIVTEIYPHDRSPQNYTDNVSMDLVLEIYKV